jgi:peroxiredoxin
VKSWASSTLLGAGRRAQLVRAALAIGLVGGLVWALPVRRPGVDGGHHAAHAPVLDPFERAGVSELREGHRTPVLRLPRLDGGVATLDEHRERLVIVNFWATWCEPCTLEMPTLEALWREYRERGLVVLAVSVDRGAPRPLIEPYVARLGLSFPILLDADLSASRAWRVQGVPATFVVRPGGDAVGMAVGAREWNSAEMRALLERYLPGSGSHTHR